MLAHVQFGVTPQARLQLNCVKCQTVVDWISVSQGCVLVGSFHTDKVEHLSIINHMPTVTHRRHAFNATSLIPSHPNLHCRFAKTTIGVAPVVITITVSVSLLLLALYRKQMHRTDRRHDLPSDDPCLTQSKYKCLDKDGNRNRTVTMFRKLKSNVLGQFSCCTGSMC